MLLLIGSEVKLALGMTNTDENLSATPVLKPTGGNAVTNHGKEIGQR